MNENGLTLEEISERCGVEPRTLRSWISEGLLAPPYKPGRGARYPEINAVRALAVRALKDVHGQSLADIRKQLMLADEAQIRDWAAEVPTPGAQTSTAREYLSRIRRTAGLEEPSRSVSRSFPKRSRKDPEGEVSLGPSFSMPPPAVEDSVGEPDLFDKKAAMLRRRIRGRDSAQLANIERLLAALEAEVRSLPPRKSRAQFWNRIGVTPDIELSVRGELNPRERAMFEQLADLIRTILTTGGADNEKDR
ncbi:MerR-like DNA binding protein [Aliiruegeria haliotis]|uniref:MerR-like DNA binding protein n=2 Tax=Aliiruegeria haliotis TaxID=1280846 RepID=A0A2T0RJE8_9RHOB|nr:MerR-like DNA binding protein [Aliiruegeria haliotis]